MSKFIPNLQLVVAVRDEVLVVRGEHDLLELLVRELELKLTNPFRHGPGYAEGAQLRDCANPGDDHALGLVVVEHHLVKVLSTLTRLESTGKGFIFVTF